MQSQLITNPKNKNMITKTKDAKGNQKSLIVIPKGVVAIEATTMDELLQKQSDAHEAYLSAKQEVAKYKNFLKKELNKN